jgi:TonB family protein
MSRSLMRLFLLLYACGPVAVRAQLVIQVGGKAIQEHADHKAFPVYPANAKAAHIQGTVVFDLRIGTWGQIESMKVISGPPMLQQAAIDCLKQWTFHPFEKDGVPVIATGQYSIIFVLSDQSNTTIGHGPQSAAPVHTVTVRVLSEDAPHSRDTALNENFDDKDSACKKEILAHQFNAATVSVCEEAAILAEKLPIDANSVARRSAFVYAATAYGDVRDFKGALTWAEKAVEVVKLGHDGNSGSSAAYATKGSVEGYLGDFPAADRDLTTAEDFDRKGIGSGPQSEADHGGYYQRDLGKNLQLHAKVLQAMGRPDEAQKKLDEAAKYN